MLFHLSIKLYVYVFTFLPENQPALDELPHDADEWINVWNRESCPPSGTNCVP